MYNDGHTYPIGSPNEPSAQLSQQACHCILKLMKVEVCTSEVLWLSNMDEVFPKLHLF